MLIGSTPTFPTQLNPQHNHAGRVESDDAKPQGSELSGTVPAEEEASASGEAPSSSESRSSAETQREERAQAEDHKLAERDREVRAHELAHLAAGGSYVTQASFTYERGSNGVMYAVDGEVGVNTSPVPGDPQATLEKAEVIRRAALAPVEPSAQDMRVAAQATSMAAEARVEMARSSDEEASPVSRYASVDEQEQGSEQGQEVDFYA